MQTEHLISLLSATGRPVNSGWLRRAACLAGMFGLVLTSAVVAIWLGARPDLATALTTPPVIAKFAFGAGVAGIALVLFERSLRPGLQVRALLPWLAVPAALLMGGAMVVLWLAPADQWSMLIFGRNWRSCLVIVPLLALCPLALLGWLARRGAPVDRRLTGIAAGLASAGIAIIAYAIHCPDDAIPFVATWYMSATIISATFATAFLPRLLRW